MKYRITKDGSIRRGEFRFPGVTIHVTVDTDPRVITRMTFESERGLNLQALQRDFKWKTPLDLMCDHDGPYGKWIQAETETVIKPPTELTDDFLEQVARDYLRVGRGYPTALGAKYGAPPRTVVRWMQLARARGIITHPPRVGAVGGELVPKSRRPRR